jgi:hypothetical protein
MMNRIPIAEIKARAMDRVEDIVRHHDIAPGGSEAGGKYLPLNPTRGDKKPGSFVIHLSGAKRGGFVEYANADEEKGDIIHLVSYCLCGGPGFKSKPNLSRACEWLVSYLGLDRQSRSERAASLERVRRDEGNREQADEKLKPLEGSLGEIYLRVARGIDIRAIPNRTGDVKFLPSSEFWMLRKKDKDNRVIESGPRFPVVISAIRDAEGQFLANHRIFILPDGTGKAPLPNGAKLIFPDSRGGVIRLNNGADNLTPEEAATHGVVSHCMLSEGVEDGETLALGCQGRLRVWAGQSLSNLCNVPLHPCVDGWLLHRQNDWAKRGALKQFEKAKVWLGSTGIPVAEIPAYVGKDINDTLRGQA